MKMQLAIMLLACSTFSLCGCAAQSNKSINKVGNTVEVNGIDLSTFKNKNEQYFLNTEGGAYRGYAEYGYDLKYINNIDNEISYYGQICDGYGEDERGIRDFKLTYQFNEENGDMYVKELVENNDYMSENKKSLNSIIPNYILLKNNISKGNSWQQNVTYKGIVYTATTEITSVTENSYSLTTTINDIEGFGNSTYKEYRTYEKNKGLISFSNSAYYDNYNDKDIEFIDFGYALNKDIE